MKTIFSILLGLLIVLGPGPWHAGTANAQGNPNKAAADALFAQGKLLLKDKKFAKACEKLAASHKLDPAIVTLLFLGDCYEKLNKKASAWSTFKQASSLAKEKNDDRQRVADVRAAALLPSITQLTVRVPAAAQELDGFVLRRDGVKMSAATFGTPIPMDMGDTKLVASAPGYKSWSSMVTVPDGGKEIGIDVPLLKKEGSAGPVPGPDPLPDPDPVPIEPESSAGNTGMLIAGIAVGAAGIIGLTVGTIFGVTAGSTNDQSLEPQNCRTAVLCTTEGLELREDARDEALVSTIMFITGGVLAAAGVTLVVLSQTLPGDDESDRSEGAGVTMELVPSIGPPVGRRGAHGSLTLRGSW